jgi:undecaprenyl pyrophosphate phosphatase UppP
MLFTERKQSDPPQIGAEINIEILWTVICICIILFLADLKRDCLRSVNLVLWFLVYKIVNIMIKKKKKKKKKKKV